MSVDAPERLNRYLARRGVASRRAADELIAAGRVTVNGATGHLGTQVSPARDRVRVDDVAVEPVALTTLMLNKPPGVVTTRRDPGGRATVMELVPEVAGLVPVGRLDADSRGLLLMTNDGELAHRVAHPRYGIHKRYRVRLSAAASDAQVRRLVDGVELEDGPARAVSVSRVAAPLELEVVMSEGRKRVIRRMVAAVGLDVTDLLRRAIGPVTLGRLAQGASRPLSDDEVRRLRAAVGLSERYG
jgi:23S rRNA pseudouridine2605 synthase